MRLLYRAEAASVMTLPGDGRHRRDARAGRLAVHMHRASAALRQAAAEFRIVQPEIVRNA